MSRFLDDYFDQGYNDDNPMPVDVLISIMQDMKNRQEGNALPDTIGAEYYFLQDFITLDMDCDFPYSVSENPFLCRENRNPYPE